MKLNPAARDLLSQIAQGEIGPALAGRARKLLDQEQISIAAQEARREEARTKRLAKSLPRRKDEAAERRRVAERHAALVRVVLARDACLCQLCPPGTILVDRAAKPGDPIDPHHLEHGSGKAKREGLHNMLCAHRSCHDAYHANVRRFVPLVREWCHARGYRLPNRKEFREAQQSTPTHGARS